MIGNDIVDLNLASIQSNWQRKGFLDKVFTEDEQEFIMSSKIPDKIVWLFWTMKESAYKVYVQQYQNRFFTPNKIKCQLTSKTEGLVHINNEEYITKSKFDTDYIYTTALIEKDKKVLSNFFRITDEPFSFQNKEYYNQLIFKVSKKFNIPSQEINIIKNEAGVPKLYQNDNQLKISISFSHHGKYGAYTFLT